MKKINLLLISSITCLLSFSQVIPNAGFENWVNNTETSQTYFVPQNWIAGDVINKVFNSSYTGISTSQSTQSHSGTYAVKMETVINSGDTLGGYIISFGSANEWITQMAAGMSPIGFPYSNRPANLQAYYKFNSTGNDKAFLEIYLTKWNTTNHTRDIIGTGFISPSNTASYSLVNMPISYLTNAYPDSIAILAGISGNNNYKPHIGTVFYLDDLSFIGNTPIGINELYTKNDVKLYPNPFNTNATIIIDTKIKLNVASIIIYDILGKEVKRINNINSNTITFEKGELLNGIYFYKLINNENEITIEKFIIE